MVHPYKNMVHAYLTTMDIFAAQNTSIGNTGGGAEPYGAGGGNYFRIGPWGQEGMRYYFMTGW